jgi:hypothetical protein
MGVEISLSQPLVRRINRRMVEWIEPDEFFRFSRCECCSFDSDFQWENKDEAKLRFHRKKSTDGESTPSAYRLLDVQYEARK